MKLSVDGNTEFDPKKLAELILFICKENEDNDRFYTDDLYRMLFMSDMLAYGYLGRSITGTRYIHGVTCPIPDPEQFWPVIKQLLEGE